MKIISLILSFLIFFPSYLFSFLPSNISEDFTVTGDGITDGKISVNGEAVSVAAKTEGGIYTFDFSAYICGCFNYFGVKYSSDAYMKGEIVYTVWGREYSEEFFLEPGENSEFFSFIDGCLDKVKSNTLCSLTFSPLDKDAADFELLGVSVFNRKIPEKIVYLETDKLKIGANLEWGGALSYLEDLDSNVQAVEKDGRIYVDSDAANRYGVKSVNDNVNLINCHDTGRLVQQSYYGTDSGDYECGYYGENKWSYNPVQGGNLYNECSKIVDIACTDSEIYIKCRPLDWAKKAEDITPSYMEARYTVNGDSVEISCRFVDFSGYPPRVSSQEIPAFYCIEPFNRFVYCKDGEIAYENSLIFWPDAGYPMFPSSENWAAFTGEFDDSFGIGIYVPKTTQFLAGVYDREKTKNTNPCDDVATSYIAAIEYFEFKSFAPYEYNYVIATGNVEQMRAAFNAAAE